MIVFPVIVFPVLPTYVLTPYRQASTIVMPETVALDPLISIPIESVRLSLSPSILNPVIVCPVPAKLITATLSVPPGIVTGKQIGRAHV